MSVEKNCDYTLSESFHYIMKLALNFLCHEFDSGSGRISGRLLSLTDHISRGCVSCDKFQGPGAAAVNTCAELQWPCAKKVRNSVLFRGSPVLLES